MTNTLTPQAYFEKIKPLRNPEEIQALCEELTDGLFNATDKPKTRVNKLTSYNKLINTIPNEELVEGENAYIQTKADGSLWKRHLHFRFTGLADTKWNGEGGINTKTIVLDRLENRRPVNPNQYLETASKLLLSDDPHELAVGLIAVTGRRPVEILARGKFSLETDLPDYLTEGYFLAFKGQAKKRDYDIPEEEKLEYRIGCLVPAEFFLEAFERFRQMPETKEILALLKSETDKGTEPEEINAMIDSRRNGSLIPVVKREFGTFLPARFGETELNNKALRAVYVRLITDRDCPQNIADLLWASRSVGHFVDTQKPDDNQLRHLVTTLGYYDYYTDGTVPFAPTPEKPNREKVKQVRAYSSDYDAIKELQHTWKLSSQQAVVKKLVELAMSAKDIKAQLVDTQSQLSQSQQEQAQSTTQIEPSDLETMVKRLVFEALKEALPQLQQQPLPEPTQPERKQQSKPPQPEKDWEAVPSEELRESKARGAAEEKIRRSFNAIANHNDYTATELNQKWVVNNQALRQLSGCNGQLVSDWIKRHQMAVDDHNNKHGLSQYHNKRHGKPITEVISW